MKHFIYTYAERTRSGTTEKTVRIYRLKRGIPHCVGSWTDTYVSEFQLVMEAMQANRLLPAKAFKPDCFGGFEYSYSSQLEEAGIASVRRVS